MKAYDFAAVNGRDGSLLTCVCLPVERMFEPEHVEHASSRARNNRVDQRRQLLVIVQYETLANLVVSFDQTQAGSKPHHYLVSSIGSAQRLQFNVQYLRVETRRDKHHHLSAMVPSRQIVRANHLVPIRRHGHVTFHRASLAALPRLVPFRPKAC